MKHTLMELPYAMDALAPYISEETLQYHYGKHHAGYVNKLNELIENTPYEALGLEQIILKAEGAIFNNAAQVFNHDFYWHSLSPNKTNPSASLQNALEKTFGSLEGFKEKFAQAAVGCFGSGWAWLVLDANQALSIVATSNAHTPIELNLTPLLVCDVWEHAYYIDQRNARAKYVENFFEVLNWEYASMLYEKASV